MPENLALITFVFVLAGTVKGVTGIGLPTVSVAILSQFISPFEAISLVVFPILVTNLWQVIRAGVGVETLRKYRVLISLLIVTLFLTTYVTLAVSAELLLSIIGVAILLFAGLSLLSVSPELPDRLDRAGQIAAGLGAGVLGGLTSIWAPPVVIYLLSRRTGPDEFVRAAGLFIFLGSLPLAIGYWNVGLLNAATAPVSALMVLPSLVGFSIGEFCRKRLNAETFRKIVLWLFLLMGLRLVFFA